MEVYLIVIGIGLLIFAGHRWDKARLDRRKRAWANVAARLGLEYAGGTICGELNGVSVSVDIHTTGSGKNKTSNTRIRAKVPSGHGVELAREGFFSRFGEDIRIGDEGFDQVARVRGDKVMALAMLDAKTREIVAGAVTRGWVLGAPGWRIYLGTNLGEEVGAYIEEAVRLASHADVTALSAGDRLVEMVRSDPELGVRQKALGYLIERYAESPSCKNAIAEALTASDGELRLMAAIAQPNHEVLIALTCDSEVASEVRARALSAAVRVIGRDDPRMIVAVDLVVAEVAHGMDEALAIVLARALAVVPNPRAEATLIGLLQVKEDAVKIAAVRALAKVGTIESVRALLPLRDRFMAFASAEAGAAKDAILAIQARAGNSEAGALALAESESGLAIVDEG